MQLVTKRLILRAARDTDLAPLFAVYGDRRAMKYWSDPPHPTIKTTSALLDDFIAAGSGLYFVVEHQGRAIGTAGLHHESEIGFILHPDYWRKGLMREAVLAIIAHVWAVTDLAQITADTDPENAASVGFLKTLGFHVTGQAKRTFCIDGIWSDSVYLALDRP